TSYYYDENNNLISTKRASLIVMFYYDTKGNITSTKVYNLASSLGEGTTQKSRHNLSVIPAFFGGDGAIYNARTFISLVVSTFIGKVSATLLAKKSHRDFF
ncbi:MAG: hypothetical protein J1E41_04650, partial [Ruminococcus sp.]|nr:hypothetical protein [Ruminococcus sp.]